MIPAPRRLPRQLPRRQAGMALMISLVVLLVVSILGATAMRSAAFQSKVSVNAQMGQVLFQSAESGLSSLERFASFQVTSGIMPQQANHMFAQAYNGTPSRVCFNAAGAGTRDFEVTREVISNSKIDLPHEDCPVVGDNPVSIAAVVARPPCELDRVVQAQGYSLGIGGWGFRSVMTQSFAQVEGLGFTKSHVQIWSILSPTSGLSTCV